MSEDTTETLPVGVGEIIRRAHEAAEQYQKPTMVLFEEPDTGIKAPALVTKMGVAEVPSTLFDPYRDGPKRRVGVARMTRLDSFIAHVNRFKDADSALFAKDDRNAPQLVAVLDYHESVEARGEFAEVDIAGIAAPRFGKHGTSFAFPLSDEWKAWIKANGTRMSMVEFAEFLEDRIVDVDLIEDPEGLNEDIRRFIGATGLNNIAGPSKLMELAKGLQVNEDSVVKQVHSLQTGEAQIRFESTHTDAAGAPLDVPGLFIICIPVFAHDGYYRIAARLRYRKTGEGIVFWYDLWRTDLVFDDAFDTACARAKDETGLPLFLGAPE